MKYYESKLCMYNYIGVYIKTCEQDSQFNDVYLTHPSLGNDSYYSVPVENNQKLTASRIRPYLEDSIKQFLLDYLENNCSPYSELFTFKELDRKELNRVCRELSESAQLIYKDDE